MKEEMLVAVFAALFLFSFSMIVFENVSPKFTGYVTETTTVSNVTISKYLSISMDTSNLTYGIYFGNLSALPAIDHNATHNYDGGNTNSTYFLSVSGDSNTAVDFCIKANAALTSGANTIPLANETYANSTVGNLTDPTYQVALTTDYAKAGIGVPIGGNNYYRFWLDVPASQESGVYNNTISFKGVTTTLAC
ncbi:MAG: hypothetical protein ACP5OG_03145 [Candidatus Nanoarchaeia archaeon]